jgi:hypothetical protein
MHLYGLVTVNSQAGPVETAERLVAVITARGLSVFARIDHAAAAAAVGLPLRTWVSYSDMTWLARGYGLPPATEQPSETLQASGMRGGAVHWGARGR